MHSQNNQLLSEKATSRQNADDNEEEASCVDEELQHPSTAIKLGYDIMRFTWWIYVMELSKIILPDFSLIFC